MAIQFLNTVDLNFNQLNKAAIQNIPTTDPLAGVLGQLIFNVAAGAIKVCTVASVTGVSNATFSEVGGGIESLTIGNAIVNTGNVNTGLAVVVTSGAATLTPAIYGGASKVGMVPTGGLNTTFLRGDGTFATPAGSYTSWGLEADTGTSVDIVDGGRVDFTGSTGISTVVAAATPNTLTIKLDDTAVTAASYTYASITVDQQGRLTAASSGAAPVTSVDAGTFVTITGTAAVPIVNAEGTTLPTASKLVARNAAGLAFAVTPASGSSDTTLATTAFVQNKLTGLLEFKGGFNATTGALDDGSGDDLYTDVVIAVGDYYVVTTAGNFFSNVATPLTVGDSVIAQKAVPDPGTTAAVEGDFVVVQSDTDLATLATVGIGNVAGTLNQIGVTYSAGTGTITNLDRGSSQNIFKTITAPIGGNVVADSNSDTLNFTVSGGMTITNTPGSDTVNFSSVNNNTEYTAGTGLTLNTLEFDVNVNATAQTVAANAVSATAARTYAVQVDLSDDLVVNVPWADTNTGALGKRIDLDSTDAWVTKTVAGGLTTFAVTVTNTNVFGTGTAALDVKCEVLTAAGQTVYADVTRSAAVISIAFTGTIADSAFQTLLTYVG